MTATLEDNVIPKQVTEDGIAAQQEIERLRADRSTSPHPDSSTTAEAGEVRHGEQPANKSGSPSHDQLKSQVEKLTSELDAQRRDFDRKWGERGVAMERINSAMTAKDDEIKALKAEIDLLRKSSIKASETPKEADKTMQESIKELFDTYGQDFVEGVQKVTGGDMQELKKRLEDQDVKLKQLSEKEEIVRNARVFWNDFEQLAPGALALNGDPALGVPPNQEFLAYLEEVVPIYEGSSITKSRRKIADELAAAKDFPTLAQLFNGFLQKKPQPEPKITASLESKVAPKVIRTIQGDPLPEREGKSVYRESEIDGWYRSLQDGASVSQAEFLAKSKEFEKAYAEGRVVRGQ
jgi:hypothetical protein